MAFILAWAAFFFLVGAANTHLAPGQPMPPAYEVIGHGMRDVAAFIWHCLQVFVTGH